MDKEAARRVLKEFSSRKAHEAALMDPGLVFGPQGEFINDDEQRKIAVCSRRAGKTFAIAVMLLRACMKHPGELAVYVTLTRSSAKEILWPNLRQINKALGLGLEFKANSGDVVCPNGAKIILRGMDDRAQAEKLRGLRMSICVIDEAQAFPHWLDDVIEDVIEPACMDMRAQIALTGTPNAACRGPFYDCAVGDTPGWSNHHWTMVENPYLPDPVAWLAEKRERSGWTGIEPQYRREYLGEWVRSFDGLVFSLKPHLNYIQNWKPEKGQNWEYVIGIDLGYNDPTAFTVLAFERNLGKVVVVESTKESELIPSVVAARTEGLIQKYNPLSIVADSGGYGKGIVEEMRQAYGIPVKPADKSKRLAAIELLNGALRNGSLAIDTIWAESLVDEMQYLQWDERKQEYGKFEFDRRFMDHEVDALRYAYLECQHNLPGWEQNPATRGTEEWWSEYVEDMWNEDQRCSSAEANEVWWDEGNERLDF